MLDLIFSWNTLWWLIILFYVPSCFGLIIIVLLQKGKGAGFGGAFGMGGGADTVFGPRMVNSLPQRLTYIMASIFMVFALVMSIVSGKVARGSAPDVVAEMDSGFHAIFETQDEAENGGPAGAGGDGEIPVSGVEILDTPIVEVVEDAADSTESAETEDAPAETPGATSPAP